MMINEINQERVIDFSAADGVNAGELKRVYILWSSVGELSELAN